MLCFQFLKCYAFNFWNFVLSIYKIQCYESSVSQNRVLSIFRIVKWGAFNIWNAMLSISEMLCFQFLKCYAFNFWNTSCFKCLIILLFHGRALDHCGAAGRALAYQALGPGFKSWSEEKIDAASIILSAKSFNLVPYRSASDF